MPVSKSTYHDAPDLPSSVVREEHIEYGFIGTLQLFIVSKRIETMTPELGFPPFKTRNSPFKVSPARHFAFNAYERFLPVYEYADEENRKITRLDTFAAELATMKKAA